MRLNIFFTIITLFIFQLYGVNAQTSRLDPKDVEGWYSATLKLDLPKKWESSFSFETRFYNNLKDYFGTYISIDATKNINKHIGITAEYRAASFSYGLTHRFTIGMEANKKIKKKLHLSGRLLLQNRIQDSYDPIITTDKNIFWRARAQAKYEITKNIDLYGSVEPIMMVGGNNFVDNWRNTIGLKCKVAKKTKLDLFYIYRPDYGKTSYNRYFHIIGVNVVYTLKVKKPQNDRDKIKATL
jgi:hypothetical protein